MLWFIRRHGPWLSTTIIGLTLIAAGSFFLFKGMTTKADITRELKAEQIVTASDARIPNVPVTDAATAQAQADAIKGHTLGQWGPYSELPRDDPRRQTYVNGVALRTALGLAVAGYGVADLAIGAGVIIIIAGAATLALASPALYFLAGMVVKREGGAA